MFRTKVMSVGDWSGLQKLFAEAFVRDYGGDERAAMFLEDAPGEEEHHILVPVFASDWFEAAWPEGWEFYEDPSDRRWTLLVGAHGANERFGLKSPAD